MQKNEKKPSWNFGSEAEVIAKCLDAAERILKVEKKKMQTLSEIRLAEHHIDMAGRLAEGLSHEEKLRKFRKRAADLRRRCGLVWRIIGRILQL